MKLNFQQPKYILPLLALPFLILFFYVYQSSSKSKQTQARPQAGINATVGDISDDLKKKELSDKLDAYRNAYKEADGYTALSPVPVEPSPPSGQRTLDSIKAAMKPKPNPPADRAMIAALNQVSQKKPLGPPAPTEKDPMQIFRQQMAYMDSLQKSNDPAVKEELKKKEAIVKAEAQKAGEKTLRVSKASDTSGEFNTIRPEKNNAFITAVIDENLTGYAGSRIRLRLLEDITAGTVTIKAGTYLYALVNGFSQQRVTFQVKSILYEHDLLPVKLDVYDLDGLPGLYVPESAFRDFTRDLGSNTIQGVSIEGNASFLMSTVDKMFQSTSSAIAGTIRKDKVKLKYNSFIYLIDNNLLNNISKNYEK